MLSFKHLRAKFFFALMNLPMNGWKRAKFAKMAGVHIEGTCFIGENVIFDAVVPENIYLGDHVHITDGSVFLTHYLDTLKEGVFWKYGTIHIGENSFIGIKTIIARPLTVGKNVIVGAGSVLTKDIPDGQIWAGNPAKFINNR